MTGYSHLLDYLGDLRGSEQLDTPPGGTAGCELSDIYLCVIAQKAKNEADPLAYLRRIALTLHNKIIQRPGRTPPSFASRTGQKSFKGEQHE